MSRWKNYKEIISASTKLGFTSFGGPVAHLAYFRNEYIEKRNWMDEKAYADIIALCQFLPGPASSQVGIAIGMVRGGLLGGFLSWFGFTMPSVIALMLFALFVQGSGVNVDGIIHGLKLVAVAVVAQALVGMGKNLAPDRERMTIAALAAITTLLIPSAIGQIGIIVVAGVIGFALYRNQKVQEGVDLALSIKKSTGVIALTIFFALLVILPILRTVFDSVYVAIFDTFYRVGSIVFGGGHVVLPMLEREVVPVGWMSDSTFLAGYGAAQAVPGPLFTLSSYLGAIMEGIPGALLATAAMFLPSFLLIIGVLPFWNSIRKKPTFTAALMGVNAAVVGILLAALYDPIFTSSVIEVWDFVIVIVAYVALQSWKVPAWLVVLLTAVAGWIVTL
ncbi:chromate efflux transporter [Mangrovibacillus cuniculi]|uniref:Chromate efflux transporter n=1 Tax=Mangrovibacillus cuniculi TaxID=2593652 RepID=A0A7S8HG22_9BACI|nr:chromate efflux transporter [Mangrovibacillus cuniculi]QPC47423.1 chromate efflux transporter [Mangrovibacillus cuniculi]